MKFKIKLASSGNAVIDIVDLIGCGGFYAADLRDALNDTKNIKSITLRLSSEGGDVYEGLAIYSMLLNHPAKVRVEVSGIAASMGSVIAMAGDEIAMAQDAFMMIHNPASGFEGTADEMRERADLLDKMRDTIVNIYARRTGNKPAAIVAAIDAETWMTAKEALSLGYCTEIIPAKSMAARLVSRRFKKTPKALRAKAQGRNMDLSDLIAKLGLDEDSSYEDVMAAIEVLQKASAKGADDDSGDDDDDTPPQNSDDDSKDDDKDKDKPDMKAMRAALKANKQDAVLAEIRAMRKDLKTVSSRIDTSDRDRLIAANLKKFSPKMEKVARGWSLAVLQEYIANADDAYEHDEAPEDTGARGPAKLTAVKEIKLTPAELNVCKITNTNPDEMLAFKKNGNRVVKKGA